VRKEIGPVHHSKAKLVWDRFRKACDHFFHRRDGDRAKRREESAQNLEKKQALAGSAEALAESTDWDASSAEIRKLQAEWKTIGPVRASESDAVWQRFHAASDRFFDRYKRRGELADEAAVEAREAICAELEGLSTDAPEGLAEKVHWRRRHMTGAGHFAGEAEARRPPGGGRRLSRPARGVRRHRSRPEATLKMEKLCAKVRRPTPRPRPRATSRHTVDLATRFEALAANTIGGHAGGRGPMARGHRGGGSQAGGWQRLAWHRPDRRRAPASARHTASSRRGPPSRSPRPSAAIGDRVRIGGLALPATARPTRAGRGTEPLRRVRGPPPGLGHPGRAARAPGGARQACARRSPRVDGRGSASARRTTGGARSPGTGRPHAARDRSRGGATGGDALREDLHRRLLRGPPPPPRPRDRASPGPRRGRPRSAGLRGSTGGTPRGRGRGPARARPARRCLEPDPDGAERPRLARRPAFGPRLPRSGPGPQPTVRERPRPRGRRLVTAGLLSCGC
jgi:hypothetical protein